MAQGIFQKKLKCIKGEYEVNSAGMFTHPNSVITPLAQKQLKKRGIDLSGRKAVQVTEKLIDKADIVLAMTSNQRRFLVQSFPASADKIHLLGDYTNRDDDVIDPYGGNEKTYDLCARNIEDMLDILIDMI